jgi:methionyl-tRNA formyltransferase
VHQPPTLRDRNAPPQAWGPAPALIVVAAYGLLLPRWLLEWPARGCVNVHASLLPRWRGAAPVQHALLAGDQQTGVSLMQLAAALDTGPVFARSAIAIGPEQTAGELRERLAGLGATLLASHLQSLLAGALQAEPQDDALATHAPKISKSDARLDLRRSAMELERRVRAFNPWPVAEAFLSDGQRLRIWRSAAIETRADAEPGTIVAAGTAGIDVATGDGLLRLLQVQAPSARPIGAAAWLAAHSVTGLRFVV